MKSPIESPGSCTACGSRVQPVQASYSVLRPHFQCTACRAVFSMNANFILKPCHDPAAHVQYESPRAQVQR